MLREGTRVKFRINQLGGIDPDHSTRLFVKRTWNAGDTGTVIGPLDIEEWVAIRPDDRERGSSVYVPVHPSMVEVIENGE